MRTSGDQPPPPPAPEGAPTAVPAHDTTTETAPWAAPSLAGTARDRASIGTTWRILLGLGWTAAFFAYAAVWQASVQLGIGTWWVGPRAQPAPTMIRLAPFAVCLTMGVLVAYGVRRVAELSVLVALGLVVFALPDLTRSTSLAATELVVAGAVLAIGAASLTGRGRI